MKAAGEAKGARLPWGLIYGDDWRLSRPALPVELDPDSVGRAAEVSLAMNRIASEARAWGIAATQLGEGSVGADERMISITETPGSRYVTLVNPVIVARSPGRSTRPESCLSFPGLSVRVKRAKTVSVEFLESIETGKRIISRFRGHLARVVQHEIDHLDGKTIADRCIRADIPRVERWLREWKG